MNVALWIVQGLLAFAFIAAGAMKLFAYEKYKIQSEKNGPPGITRGLATFIGTAELAGGLGLVLPMARRIRTGARSAPQRHRLNTNQTAHRCQKAPPQPPRPQRRRSFTGTKNGHPQMM